MEHVIAVLMRRDGISREEAVECIESVLEDVNFYVEEGEFEEAEIAWEQGVGLEVDYLMEVLL